MRSPAASLLAGSAGRYALYARAVLPPLENRDPGDENPEDDD